MAQDIFKCITANNWHEGNAVTTLPVNSLPAAEKIIIFERGNQNKSWTAYDIILDMVGNKLAYYYLGT